jgi:hypothetical protein
MQGMVAWVAIGCEVHLLYLLHVCLRALEVLGVVASTGGGPVILTLVEVVIETI